MKQIPLYILLLRLHPGQEMHTGAQDLVSMCQKAPGRKVCRNRQRWTGPPGNPRGRDSNAPAVKLHCPASLSNTGGQRTEVKTARQGSQES